MTAGFYDRRNFFSVNGNNVILLESFFMLILLTERFLQIAGEFMMIQGRLSNSTIISAVCLKPVMHIVVPRNFAEHHYPP